MKAVVSGAMNFLRGMVKYIEWLVFYPTPLPDLRTPMQQRKDAREEVRRLCEKYVITCEVCHHFPIALTEEDVRKRREKFRRMGPYIEGEES